VVNFIEGISKYGNPIAKKYREGKMKRTLKRELKLPETAEKEAVGTVTISFVGTVAVASRIESRCFGSNSSRLVAGLLEVVPADCIGRLEFSYSNLLCRLHQ